MILDAQAIVVNVTVPIDIAVNETKILIYDFNSTPCVNVLDPVMQASAGVVIDSYSSYCWGISITVSNTSGINGTINSIQVTGTPYKEGVSNRVIIKDDKAIRADGMVKVNIQHDFIQTIEQAQSIATTLVSAYKSAKQDIVIEGRGDIAIKLGDRATVETYDTFNEYMITRRQVKWDGSLSVKTYGKKI
jgi:RNA-binding protein YhbY